MIKVTNTSKKPIGFGSIILLPDESADVDESKFSFDAIKAMERLGDISFVPVKKAAPKAVKEDIPVTEAVEDEAPVEEPKPAKTRKTSKKK